MAISRFDEVNNLVGYWSAAESTIGKTGNDVNTVSSVYGSNSSNLVPYNDGNFTEVGDTIGTGLLPALTVGTTSNSGLMIETFGTIAAASGITVAVVEQRNSTSSGNQAFYLARSSISSEEGSVTRESGTGMYQARFNNVSGGSTISMVTTPAIVVWRYDGNTGATLRVNGTEDSSSWLPSAQSNDYGNLIYGGPTGIGGKQSIWLLYDRALNSTEITDIETLCQYWLDNGEAPSTEPPTTVTFGPVATNDDPSVTEWNWEASADGGTNWDEAENVLSDVSGEATTSLVVNSATLAENGTQVRCRAISAKEPAGVESAVATLTVQAAS